MANHNKRNNVGQFTSNQNGKAKPTAEKFTYPGYRELVMNAVTSRRSFLDDLQGDRRRDIDDEAGYPKEVANADFTRLYDREAIAVRVVELMPKESWKLPPQVFETEDVEEETEFEKAWTELPKSLNGDSWFTSEDGNPIWDLLQRADILSGIGSYGVIFLGVEDGATDLSQPVEPKDGMKLLFARTLDESLATITQFEEDRTNPRFGMPTRYELTFIDSADGRRSGDSAIQDTSTTGVHWSRIIHIADNLRSSEIYGIPRMRQVYNRIFDLQKLYSGSAEMYWKGAFPGISFETQPQLGGDVPIDASATRDQMEQYFNGLQRYLLSTGMTANSLAPQVVDPTPQIDTQIEAICIKLGIPKRIFTGSERGELASSQDMMTWNSRVKGRQNAYLSPRVVAPVIDRLISLGVLPEPEEYSVVWPDMISSTDEERANVALLQTDAMSKYVQGGVESMINVVDYLTRIIGMSDDDALEVAENATAKIEEDIASGIVPDPTKDIEMEQKMAEANLKTAQLPPIPPAAKK